MAIVINGSGTVTGLAVGGLPDGTVDAGTLATDSVTAAKLEVNAITGADLPAGSVLQVVSTIKSDAFSSTGTTSFVDITGLSASITPISTSSKIMVMVNLKGAARSHGSFRIARGSTAIGVGAASGSRTRAGAHSATNASTDAYTEYTTFALDMHVLDSPATASAVTYKVQGGTPYQSNYVIYVNRSVDNSNSSWLPITASTITLMEVAG